jgi:glycosyltransferase involved in cell wall biosynthesis
MKERILFDGIATQSTTETPFHGGGEYAKFVLRKAVELGYRNFDIVFSKKMIVDENVKDLVNTTGIHVYYVDAPKDVYTILATNKYDCFYSALAHVYKEYNLDTLFIMVIHGMRSIELPWDEYRYKYYHNLLKRLFAFVITRSKFLQGYLRRKHIRYMDGLINVKNKKIITVSEHSKYSMLYYFPHVDINCITIWFSPNCELGKIEENHNRKKNEYFLMMNANRWEKNIARAVEAFDALFSRRQLKDRYVVITGCTESCHFLKKIKNKDKFKLLSYIKESELEDMYKRSFAFVYPSLNEGFGIPPLRAMKYGIPVIASSATSIPEVCGNAVLYFDPHSVEDLANRVLQVTYNSDLYGRLVENGYRKYQQYQQNLQTQQLREIFE